MTNYEKIKAMSVEEMAEFIPDWSFKACKISHDYIECDNECEKCVKEWLESEVEENG